MIYDKFAKGYDRVFSPFERRFLSDWRRETLSHLPENSKILEVGAGTGANFRFYPSCEKAVASEISYKMLEIARGKTTSIRIVQTDAENLPFASDYFDAAFATLVFCSLANPEDAFRELSRTVKNGGKIVLLEHVRPPGLAGLPFDLINLLTVPLFKDHFNRRTAEIARRSGLTILEVKKKAFGIVNLIVCEVRK